MIVSQVGSSPAACRLARVSVPLKLLVEKANYIPGMVALRENPGRCGSERAGAAAALRLGFVLRWGSAGVGQ